MITTDNHKSRPKAVIDVNDTDGINDIDATDEVNDTIPMTRRSWTDQGQKEASSVSSVFPSTRPNPLSLIHTTLQHINPLSHTTHKLQLRAAGRLESPM